MGLESEIGRMRRERATQELEGREEEEEKKRVGDGSLDRASESFQCRVVRLGTSRGSEGRCAPARGGGFPLSAAPHKFLPAGHSHSASRLMGGCARLYLA
jgi:hypothetical protein